MSLPHSSARLVILDHCLMQPDGHSMTLARAVLDTDPSAVVWANVNCRINDPRVLPVFPHSNMHPDVRFPASPAGGGLKKIQFLFAVISRTIRANRSFGKALEGGEKSPVIWFSVNGNVRNAFALLARCWRHPEDAGFCYLLQDPGRWLLLAEGVRKFLRIGNFHFVAETAELASRISRVMHGSCRVLPFPVPGAESSPVRKPIGKPLVAGFLGMPRREKGFDVLTKAVGLLSPEMRDGALSFRLQAPVAYLKMEGMEDELSALQKWSNDGQSMDWVSHDLDENAYRDLLKSCDFLVIPYRASAYARRSSLVPIEGLLEAKPLVITRGLLVNQSLPPDAGWIDFADGDAVALAAAIREMLAKFPDYQAKAHAIEPAWRHPFTSKSFVSTIRSWVKKRAG